jgi:hypothetical protein
MNSTPASSQIKPRGKSAPLRPVVQQPRSNGRSLLALDGANLSPQLLSAAESRCLQMSGRIEILLVNSPKAPESLLHRLLISLERAGVDYRLTSASGDFGDKVTHFLRRHIGITQIMVATLPALGKGWDVKVADLRYQGYGFSTLIGLKDI